MKVVVITQARSGSSRLPKKVLLQIQEKSLLQIHIERIKKAKQVDEIYIATTSSEKDNIIVEIAKKLGVKYHQGSENDVLDRFYQTIKNVKPDLIVRLTSDCPLIDPKLLDEVILEAKAQKVDYYANIMEERYPDGQDIEVFTFNALEKAWKETKLKSDREHVTPYIRNNSSYKNGTLFSSANHNLDNNFNHVRLTVDEPSDFKVMEEMIVALGTDKDWKTYTNYYLDNENLNKLNRGITRNEGYKKSIEQDNSL